MLFSTIPCRVYTVVLYRLKGGNRVTSSQCPSGNPEEEKNSRKLEIPISAEIKKHTHQVFSAHSVLF